jgi:C4-dicarboxylate-specific signal transduction histidine kinase
MSDEVRSLLQDMADNTVSLRELDFRPSDNSPKYDISHYLSLLSLWGTSRMVEFITRRGKNVQAGNWRTARWVLGQEQRSTADVFEMRHIGTRTA